jgi:YesN/AraC family two-component response regulator
MFRILIVEDSRSYRESLKDILDGGKFPSIVLDEAENGKEAMEKVDSFCPNLIFMDIGLPDENGIQLTKKIKTKYPNVRIVMLTSHDGPEYREAAICCGASHYLAKGNVSRQEIQNVVKSSLSLSEKNGKE